MWVKEVVHVVALCRTSWKSKGKKKKDDKSQKLDLYALLGLQNERWTATASAAGTCACHC